MKARKLSARDLATLRDTLRRREWVDSYTGTGAHNPQVATDLQLSRTAYRQNRALLFVARNPGTSVTETAAYVGPTEPKGRNVVHKLVSAGRLAMNASAQLSVA